MSTVSAKLRLLAWDLWRDGRGWILIAVSAGWLLSHGVRLIYPALVPFYQQTFQVSLTTVGFVLTALWAAYALGQLPGGLLGDTFGERKILAFSTGLSALTVLVIATASSIWVFVAGTLAFGFATALFGPTRFTIFSDIYPERTGAAMGLTMAAGSLGDSILPLCATVLATAVSWRLGFGITIPLFVAVTVGLWFIAPARTSTTPVSGVSGQSLRRFGRGLNQQSIPAIVSVQVFMSFVFQGFIGFFPTYLVYIKGLSPRTAAVLFSVFLGLGLIVQPLAGASMDAFGIKRALAGVLSVVAVGLWALTIIEHLVGLLGLTVLLSSLRGYGVITQTYLTEALPAEMKGSGLGALRSGWMLLGAASPIVIGALGDQGYFGQAFVMLAVCSTIGLVLYVTRL